VNFKGKWTSKKAQRAFLSNSKDKNTRLAERQMMFDENPIIKAIVYFNLDMTEGMTKQVGGQAEWSIILSPHHADYDKGVDLLTQYDNPRSVERLFRVKKK